MEKESVLRGLQEAINDYNLWNKGENAFINRDSNDRRGIFYNKFIARLRLVSGFYDINKDLYGRLLEPDDFRPFFSIDGYMRNLEIVMFARHQFRTGTKHKFLILLQDLVPSLIYNILPDADYYELSSIVNQLKAYKV